MILSAEITLYPLQDNYLPIIKATIEKLNSFPDICVSTVPTATILIGDYDLLMDAIKETIKWSYNEYGKCVFVTKYLPGYEAR